MSNLSSQPNGTIPTQPTLEELLKRDYITLTQLVNLQGVVYRTGLKWIKQGKVKATKVGGEWRIYEDELRRFLTEGNYIEKGGS